MLKGKYPTANAALVNYDSVDVANGTGYETYYLIQSQDNTGAGYHLTPTTDYSSTAVLGVNNSTEDHDYDLTAFTIPRTLNGTALISLAVDGDAGGATFTAIAEIYRYDGSTETQLGSTVTYAVALSAPKMLYMEIPIVNEIIPEGEVLRLRISFGVPGVSQGYLGIDPAGRTDSNLTITTTSKVHIPYKLDL